jgi:hypothetical protein
MDRYQQLQRLDPLLARKVVRNPATGCWIWTGCKTSSGYGRVGRTDDNGVKKWRAVHRRVYRLLEDPDLVERPGKGSAMTLDHLCRVRACCNPAHLTPVTRRQNVINGELSKLGAYSSNNVGVHWYKRYRTWTTQVKVIGKNRHLGYYVNEIDAALTYDAACTLLGIEPQNTAAGTPDAGHIADATRHLVRHGLLEG